MDMTKIQIVGLVLVLVAIVFVSGCIGDSKEKTTTKSGVGETEGNAAANEEGVTANDKTTDSSDTGVSGEGTKAKESEAKKSTETPETSTEGSEGTEGEDVVIEGEGEPDIPEDSAVDDALDFSELEDLDLSGL